MFEQNVGTLDRALRIGVGVVMLMAFAMMPEASMRWFLLIGIVPLATGLLGTCGLYKLIGMNTCDWPKR